jgi:hypothetical protein
MRVVMSPRLLNAVRPVEDHRGAKDIGQECSPGPGAVYLSDGIANIGSLYGGDCTKSTMVKPVTRSNIGHSNPRCVASIL